MFLDAAVMKGPTSVGKSKKSRKSPTPGEFDGSTNREDVTSPAYSDISDDSVPVIDSESGKYILVKFVHFQLNLTLSIIILDKQKGTPPTSDTPSKKPPLEISGSGPPPPPIGSLGGYGMYPMYPNISPYGYPPDHPNAPKVLPCSPQIPPSSGSHASRSDGKEPPLELINKPGQQSDPSTPSQSSSKEPPHQGIPPPNQGKGLPPHFYPYGR